MGSLIARQLYNTGNGVPEAGCDDTKISDNEVLRWAIRGYGLTNGRKTEIVKPLVTIAMFVALLDEDPMVAMKWMKANRLTFFSVPGFKGQIYENLQLLQSNGKNFGFTERDIAVFEMLAEKLEPLKGM